MVHGMKHGQIQNVRAEMEAASIHYITASPALHPYIIAFEQRMVTSCLVPSTYLDLIGFTNYSDTYYSIVYKYICYASNNEYQGETT